MPNRPETVLQTALKTLRDLEVPEPLQPEALRYLLANQADSAPTVPGVLELGSGGGVPQLREFIKAKNPKGAVEEIPCLLYWAKNSNKQEAANEDAVRTLYKLANLRPPKVIAQTLRDLSSKKRGYMRVEPVKGKTGWFKLTHAGEVFVEFDVGKTAK